MDQDLKDGCRRKPLMPLLFTVLLCLTCPHQMPQSSHAKQTDLNLLEEFIRARDLGHAFLLRRMRNPAGGFYSTYLEGYPNSSSYGVNHEVTSESTGLAMRYAIKSGNLTLFSEMYDFLKKYQIGRLGTTYWKLNPDLTPFRNFVFSSALIDDLRIIDALITGYEVWKDRKYLELAKVMIDGIKKYKTEDGFLVENLDWTTDGTGTRSKTTILGYLDLKALHSASHYEHALTETYTNTLKLVLNAQFNTTGLFYERYNTSSRTYFNPEARTSTILQLLTASHLAEAGHSKEANASYAFLKEAFLRDGAVASSYDPAEGFHPDDEVDTGSYSLFAALATALEDVNFSSLVLKTKVLPKQNLNESSQLYGAFVTTWPGEILDANSWDNILTLYSLETVISILGQLEVGPSMPPEAAAFTLIVGVLVVMAAAYILKAREAVDTARTLG